jgi:hypothetical protein
MTIETQARFAARLGVARSTVTRFKHEQRLVMTADGRVDVEGSLLSLEATQGVLPHQIANRERLEEARREQGPAQPQAQPQAQSQAQSPERPPAAPQEPQGPISSDTLAKLGAKTKFEAYRKLKADADRSELETALAQGLAVLKADVQRDILDAAGIILGAWETLPDRLAPVMVGIDDQARIRAILRDEIEQLQQQISDQLNGIARGRSQLPTIDHSQHQEQ